jgi:hypothetical protein
MRSDSIEVYDFMRRNRLNIAVEQDDHVPETDGKSA